MSKHLDLKTLREDIDTHVHALATDVRDGVLSKEDKLKLDSIEDVPSIIRKQVIEKLN